MKSDIYYSYRNRYKLSRKDSKFQPVLIMTVDENKEKQATPILYL